MDVAHTPMMLGATVPSGGEPRPWHILREVQGQYYALCSFRFNITRYQTGIDRDQVLNGVVPVCKNCIGLYQQYLKGNRYIAPYMRNRNNGGNYHPHI